MSYIRPLKIVNDDHEYCPFCQKELLCFEETESGTHGRGVIRFSACNCDAYKEANLIFKKVAQQQWAIEDKLKKYLNELMKDNRQSLSEDIARLNELNKQTKFGLRGAFGTLTSCEIDEEIKLLDKEFY